MKLVSKTRTGLWLLVLILALTQTWGFASHQTQTQEESSKPPVGEQEQIKKKTDATRIDEWKEKRLSKQEQVKPARQHFLERIFKLLDSKGGAKTLEPVSFIPSTPLWDRHGKLLKIPFLNHFGFAPAFGKVAEGSSWGPGVRFWQPRFAGSRMEVFAQAAYTMPGYRLHQLQLGDVPTEGETFYWQLEIRHRLMPKQDFYGLGPDSSVGLRSNFLQEDRFYGGSIGAGPQWLRAAVRAGLLTVNLAEGWGNLPDVSQIFGQGSLPGLNRQPGFLHISSVLALDYRDERNNPHQGGFVAASFSRFDDRGGREFEFNRYGLEVRHYLPLGSSQRVLALRGFTSLDEADRHSRVPFYMQETLGGGTLLRGFDRFRFRDENLLYFSGEYRWEANQSIELALLYDAGKVFSDRSELSLWHLRKSAGVGIRFKSERSVLFRLDVARSSDGTQFRLALGPSF